MNADAPRAIWLDEGDYIYRPTGPTKPTDPHMILEVTPVVTEDELRKAYRRKMSYFHPDRWDAFAQPWAHKQMQIVERAYSAIAATLGLVDNIDDEQIDAFTREPLVASRGIHRCRRCRLQYHHDTLLLLPYQRCTCGSQTFIREA